MIAYRICERKNNKLYTLFHGINGSREFPLRVWMKADIKDVYDGSPSRAKKYLSGFHCLESIDECRDFVKKFRRERDLVLVKCQVDGIRHKTHSHHNVLLVDFMKLLGVVEKLEFIKK